MKILILILFLWFIVTKPAYAYLDPGSISAIFTAIVGVNSSSRTAIGLYWNKIKNFLKKLFGKNYPKPFNKFSSIKYLSKINELYKKYKIFKEQNNI